MFGMLHLKRDIRFMVFPTHKDVFVVETGELLNDILNELDLIEQFCELQKDQVVRPSFSMI